MEERFKFLEGAEVFGWFHRTDGQRGDDLADTHVKTSQVLVFSERRGELSRCLPVQRESDFGALLRYVIHHFFFRRWMITKKSMIRKTGCDLFGHFHVGQQHELFD